MAGYKPKSLDEINSLYDKTLTAKHEIVRKASDLGSKSADYVPAQANKADSVEAEYNEEVVAAEQINGLVDDFIKSFGEPVAVKKVRPVSVPPTTVRPVASGRIVETKVPVQESIPVQPIQPAANERPRLIRSSERNDLFEDYKKVMNDEDEVEAPHHKKGKRKTRKLFDRKSKVKTEQEDDLQEALQSEEAEQSVQPNDNEYTAQTEAVTAESANEPIPETVDNIEAVIEKVLGRPLEESSQEAVDAVTDNIEEVQQLPAEDAPAEEADEAEVPYEELYNEINAQAIQQEQSHADDTAASEAEEAPAEVEEEQEHSESEESVYEISEEQEEAQQEADYKPEKAADAPVAEYKDADEEAHKPEEQVYEIADEAETEEAVQEYEQYEESADEPEQKYEEQEEPSYVPVAQEYESSDEEAYDEQNSVQYSKHIKKSFAGKNITLLLMLLVIILATAVSAVKAFSGVNTDKLMCDKYYLYSAHSAYNQAGIKKGDLVLVSFEDVEEGDIFAYKKGYGEYSFAKLDSVLNEESIVADNDGQKTIVFKNTLRGVFYKSYPVIGGIAGLIMSYYAYIMGALLAVILILFLLVTLLFKNKKIIEKQEHTGYSEPVQETSGYEAVEDDFMYLIQEDGADEYDVYRQDDGQTDADEALPLPEGDYKYEPDEYVTN